MRTMTTVEIDRALPRLERLLAQHERIFVTRRGKVIAEFEAIDAKAPRPKAFTSQQSRDLQCERKRPPIKGRFVR